MPPLTAPVHNFHQKIESFCELRLARALPKHDYDNLRHYMLDFVVRRAMPPQTGNKLDWKEIGLACDLDDDSLRITKRLAKHGFEAIIRWLKGPSASKPDRKVPTGQGWVKAPAAPARRIGLEQRRFATTR
ncbi:hypothetical protein LPJGGPFB_03492 [Ensifer adhaerens]|uniref:Uncharacterized protein n=1 Tax=Ensifer adhaerens TaxID=106592 RepID=A0ACC5SRF7_ENSAD|nr:hypothetical protein [Ensifer adhaerens]MBP1871471.1 hypothetical protein [Ensifer adhaerens]NRP20233.1 hypothetical protein [Ensifer adhaerens]